MANQKSLKIVLLGDGGTGKSTFIRKLLSNAFAEEYEPTRYFEVSPIDVQTSAGDVRFFCWDTAGQEKFGELRDGFYNNADAAIVFYDVSSRVTSTHVVQWTRDFVRVCGDDVPIAICANKVDLPNRVVKQLDAKLIKELKDVHYTHIETSVLNGKNILAPFEFLVKELLDAELVYSDSSQAAPAPSSTTSTPLTGKRDRRNLLKRAADTPLPAEDV